MIELHLHVEFIASKSEDATTSVLQIPSFLWRAENNELTCRVMFLVLSVVLSGSYAGFERIWNQFWENCWQIPYKVEIVGLWLEVSRIIGYLSTVSKIFTRIRSRYVAKSFLRIWELFRFVENLKISAWSIAIQLLSLNNILALPRLCWSSHNLVNSASLSTDQKGTNRYFPLSALSWYNFPRSFHRRGGKEGGKSFISSGK